MDRYRAEAHGQTDGSDRQRRCPNTPLVIGRPHAFFPRVLPPDPTRASLYHTMPGSISSLDSSLDSTSSDGGYDSEDEYALAQQEWEESLEQLTQLVSIVFLPFFGRWMGRKWSYWGT